VIPAAPVNVLRKFGYEMAPLLLAFVLGDRLEENLRLALTMSGQLCDVRGSCFPHRADLRARLAAGVQALAWVFGYRKSVADEAEGHERNRTNPKPG